MTAIAAPTSVLPSAPASAGGYDKDAAEGFGALLAQTGSANAANDKDLHARRRDKAADKAADRARDNKASGAKAADAKADKAADAADKAADRQGARQARRRPRRATRLRTLPVRQDETRPTARISRRRAVVAADGQGPPTPPPARPTPPPWPRPP
jgi:hypothetical protein